VGAEGGGGRRRETEVRKKKIDRERRRGPNPIGRALYPWQPSTFFLDDAKKDICERESLIRELKNVVGDLCEVG